MLKLLFFFTFKKIHFLKMKSNPWIWYMPPSFIFQMHFWKNFGCLLFLYFSNLIWPHRKEVRLKHILNKIKEKKVWTTLFAILVINLNTLVFGFSLLHNLWQQPWLYQYAIFFFSHQNFDYFSLGENTRLITVHPCISALSLCCGCECFMICVPPQSSQCNL